MEKKANVYQIVTDKIIEQLETVKIGDYSKPWFDIGRAIPRNAISKKNYRGINIFLLHGIGSGNWASYKQWASKDCQVKKGEKSSVVTYWNITEKVNKDGKKEKVFFLRYYRVFEACQVEGDYARSLEQPVKLNTHSAIPNAERVLMEYMDKHLINMNEGDQAAYSPVRDCVIMPKLGQFNSPEQYYSVWAHECVHSTGHSSRLDRKLTGRFGSEDYAKEELIAELGSAMLCAELGLENLPRLDHAAYIKSWLAALRNDSKLVVQAASKAQKACDLIMARQEVKGQEETKEEELEAA
jgi:antirestriction protein ArdC